MTTVPILERAQPTRPLMPTGIIRVLAVCVFALAAVNIGVNRYTAGATVFLDSNPVLHGTRRDVLATLYFEELKSEIAFLKRAVVVAMAVMTMACAVVRHCGRRVAPTTLIALILAWLAIAASNLSPTAHWTALSCQELALLLPG